MVSGLPYGFVFGRAFAPWRLGVKSFCMMAVCMVADRKVWPDARTGAKGQRPPQRRAGAGLASPAGTGVGAAMIVMAQRFRSKLISKRRPHFTVGIQILRKRSNQHQRAMDFSGQWTQQNTCASASFHAIYHLRMADFLKLLGSIFGDKENDERSLEKRLGEIFPCEPGALYRAGDRVGNWYEVIGMLGKGGNGVVYLVLSLSDQQFYALKTFRDEFLASGAAREAFKRELSVWVGLGKHPNILELHKVLEYSGRLFVEMECVFDWNRRISLQDQLKKRNGPLDSNQSLDWAIQFCFGMEHARACGVVCHQDIKPGNILITSKGTLKIADFGLAAGAVMGRRGAGGGSFISGGKEGNFGLSLIQVGGKQLCGTPGYMAPEVYRGELPDQRSDIYSFGIVLSQMANGSSAPPFGGQNCAGVENYLELIYRQQMSGLLPRVNGPLRLVITKCLQAEPSHRYGSFRDLRCDLEKILRERTGRTVQAPVADTQTVFFWNHKGCSLVALGRADEAIACFDKALAIEPRAAHNWYNKGTAFYKLGRYKEAGGCFQQALELDANFAQAWSGMGDCYSSFKTHMEACRCYDKALEINPKDFAVWNNRGVTLVELGRLDEAITNFDKALALDPRNAISWAQKANALLKLRRDREAIGCLDNALAIDPRYYPAWFLKAKTEQALGHLREARQSYRNYVSVTPAHSNDVAFAQQQLRQLG